jgi:hypothetical protein
VISESKGRKIGSKKEDGKRIKGGRRRRGGEKGKGLTGATLRNTVPAICDSPVTLPTLARFGAESMMKSIDAPESLVSVCASTQNRGGRVGTKKEENAPYEKYIANEQLSWHTTPATTHLSTRPACRASRLSTGYMVNTRASAQKPFMEMRRAPK